MISYAILFRVLIVNIFCLTSDYKDWLYNEKFYENLNSKAFSRKKD